MYALVILYGFNLAYRMVKKYDANKSMNLEMLDLSNNPELHKPGMSNFTLAFSLNDAYGDPIAFDSTYFTIALKQKEFVFDNITGPTNLWSPLTYGE